MVEVFKTNVQDRAQANMLVNEIHKAHIQYTANFDLDDCDRILRIKSTLGCVHIFSIINLLKGFGFEAEVLPDEENISSRAGGLLHVPAAKI